MVLFLLFVSLSAQAGPPVVSNGFTRAEQGGYTFLGLSPESKAKKNYLYSCWVRDTKQDDQGVTHALSARGVLVDCANCVHKAQSAFKSMITFSGKIEEIACEFVRPAGTTSDAIERVFADKKDKKEKCEHLKQTVEAALSGDYRRVERNMTELLPGWNYMMFA